MAIPTETGEERPFQGGAAWLPGPIRRALSVPPPRHLPTGVVGRLARGQMTLAFWMGVALTNVGGLYALVFVAMRAPWQIPAAAGAVAAVGVLLLLGCAAGVARRRGLFRHGVVTVGVLDHMARPGPGAPKPRFGTSTEAVYRFTDSRGREHRVSATLLWSDLFVELADGSPVAVLYLPDHPRRSLPLIALV